jgi:multidrug efflux pump subunit AcrB
VSSLLSGGIQGDKGIPPIRKHCIQYRRKILFFSRKSAAVSDNNKMKKIFEFFASPEDVELKVTNKIEDDLESITGIERITSTSLENISVINVIININSKDLEEAKTDIRDAVGRVTDFPPFESYTSEKNVVTFAQLENPIETGEVIVMSNFEGPVIKVKDLAVIRDDFEDESLIARIDGKEQFRY